jgi:hypothetical protein
MASSLLGMFSHNDIAGALSNNFNNAIGDMLKQAIGQSNLPQFIKDAACEIIDLAISDAQQPTCPEAQSAVDEQHGQACQDGAKDIMDQLFDTMSKMLNELTDDATGQSKNKKSRGQGEASASEGAGSASGTEGSGETMDMCSNWLSQLAKAMSKIAGQHLQNAANLAKEIGQLDTGDEEQAKEMTQKQAVMSSEAQLGNMMMQATSQVLKTIGEGLAALARKQ